MILNTRARMYYSVAITTEPTLPSGATWSASFDEGATWVAGEPDPETSGSWRWLVAGPTATPDDATVIAKQVVPLLACDVGDEHIVEDGPLPIRITN